MFKNKNFIPFHLERYTHTTRSSSAKNIKNSTSASTKYHNPPKYEKVVYKKSDKFKEVQVKGGGIIPSRRKLPQHQQPLMNDKQSHRPVPVNAVDDNGRRSPSFSLDELHVDYDLLEIDKRLESLHQFLMSTQIE